MRRNKTAAAGAICGVLCALCVLGYTQSVRGEAERARADALARYGGDQVEVCVAKRDIAAGETVDSGAVETRLWVADLLPPEAVRQTSEVVGSKASSTVLSGEVLSARRFGAASAAIDVPDGKVAISVPAKDVQAVGGAVGHNPISIILPCHRVVGSNGSLTGYAGGVERKVALLTLEGADMSRLFVPGKGTAL